MTLKDFLDANTSADALITLYNEDEDDSFAVVSANSSASLTTALQAKKVMSYTIASPAKIKVILETE